MLNLPPLSLSEPLVQCPPTHMAPIGPYLSPSLNVLLVCRECYINHNLVFYTSSSGVCPGPKEHRRTFSPMKVECVDSTCIESSLIAKTNALGLNTVYARISTEIPSSC